MAEDIDLNYRPRSYWLQPAAAHIISRISGTVRRAAAERLYEEAGLAGLQGWVTKAELDASERAALGGIHPAMLGGEYLPPLKTGEVEIVRITLASVTGDVASVRARKLASGDIEFAVVDEYYDESPIRYEFAPKTSARPLSLQELVSLIESIAHLDESPYNSSPIWGFLEICLEEPDCGGLFSEEVSDDEAARTLDGRVVVTSTFYPGLEEYFHMRVRDYAAQRRREWRTANPPEQDEKD